MPKNIKLALIYGSNREGRFCDVIGTWLQTQMKSSQNFTLDVIDIAQFEVPSRLNKHLNPSMQDMGIRLAGAEAIIILTPEYNHSFPAALKAVIDTFKQQWEVKPIAFVSYGGQSGGIRAVEQLRQVFVELHAVCIRAGVSFANAWSQFDPNGQLLAPASAQKALEITLKQLHWWATALTNAREQSTTPYHEVIA